MYKRILAVSLAICLSCAPLTAVAQENEPYIAETGAADLEDTAEEPIEDPSEEMTEEDAEEGTSEEQTEEEPSEEPSDTSDEEESSETPDEEEPGEEPDEKVELLYQAHVQKIGWQDWKNSGEQAGTTGESLRLSFFYQHDPDSFQTISESGTSCFFTILSPVKPTQMLNMYLIINIIFLFCFSG